MADKIKVSADIPMCDVHHDAVAIAVCHYHKTLLCLTCVLDKAKSTDCSIKEIQKQSEEKDTMLLQCILVRQRVRQKTRSLIVHEAKTDVLTKELEQKVIDKHENLTKRLAEMKENCLKRIDESSKNVKDGNDTFKLKLSSFETIIEKQMERLTGETVEDLGDIVTCVKDVQNELEDIPDRETTPEGHFKPNTHLDELMKQGALLGEVFLMDQQHYETINNHSVKADTNPSNPIYSTSDEIKDEITRKNDGSEKITNEETNPSEDVSITKMSPDPKCQQKIDITYETNTKVPGAKPEKKSGGLFNFKLFSSNKKKTDRVDKTEKVDKKDEKEKDSAGKKMPSSEPGKDTENIDQESTFNMPANVSPKNLINKTIEINSLNDQFESACKFSDLVDLGDGYIGMLSKTHKSLVVAGTNGEMCGAKKTFKDDQLAIVATENHTLAVLAESGLQLSKFKYGEKGMSTVGGCMVHEEISNIIGFDFDVSSASFAVTTPNQVFLLDKNGRKLEVLQHDKDKLPETIEMASVYDFSKKLLYILKIKDKSLKCYSFDKSAALWKRRLGDQSFTPRSMCLYKDKLCIACGKSVAVFSASSGEPLNKYDVKYLLDDCLGMCIIDDVIVLSSNSESLAESATLAFICI